MECYECGIKGHKGKDCKNQRFLANKNWECGCNINQLQQVDFNGPTKTHCCECGRTARTLDMEWHQTQIGKMRCMKCKYGEEYDSNVHKRYRFNNTQRRFPRQGNQPIEEKSNFGKCINCGKQPTSSIQSVLQNGLCRVCDSKKENFERYGSTSAIRTCWTCGTISDTYDSNAAGEVFCTEECNWINQIIYRINIDKSNRPIESLINAKTREVLLRKQGYEDNDYTEEIKQKVTTRLNDKPNEEIKPKIVNEYDGPKSYADIAKNWENNYPMEIEEPWTYDDQTEFNLPDMEIDDQLLIEKPINDLESRELKQRIRELEEQIQKTNQEETQRINEICQEKDRQWKEYCNTESIRISEAWNNYWRNYHQHMEQPPSPLLTPKLQLINDKKSDETIRALESQIEYLQNNQQEETIKSENQRQNLSKIIKDQGKTIAEQRDELRKLKSQINDEQLGLDQYLKKMFQEESLPKDQPMENNTNSETDTQSMKSSEKSSQLEDQEMDVQSIKSLYKGQDKTLSKIIKFKNKIFKK